MNSSSAQTAPGRFSGRVLLGCDTPGAGFISIQEAEGKRKPPAWDELTEAEYMERSRKKAEAMAKDILQKALAKAQAEAQAIREQARAEVDQAVAEARDQALAETQARLDVEYQAQVAAMARTLAGLTDLGRDVWAVRRRDFASLTKGFVKKALLVELSEQRKTVLERLMDEACQRLEAHRDFTLRVAPEDFEIARELMEGVRQSRPDLGAWKITQDDGLAMGGVILETSEMLADNSVGNRVALLDPYLEQLGLPEDPAEAMAGAETVAPAAADDAQPEHVQGKVA